MIAPTVEKGTAQEVLPSAPWLLGYRLPRPYTYAPAQRPDARDVREEVGM